MLILALVEPFFVWQKNVKKKTRHAKIVHVTNSLDVFSNSSLRARARMLVVHHHVFFFSNLLIYCFFFSVIHAVTVVTVQCLVAE